MVFLTLHPCNVAIALFYRLFGPVAYWRNEGLPRWLLAPFEAITPAKHISSPDWNDLVQDVHVAYQRAGGVTPVLPIPALDVRGDFGPIWLQWFLLQFEFDALGQQLARAWARDRHIARCRVVQSGIAAWSKIARVPPPSVEGVARVRGSKFADCTWETLKGLRVVASAVVRCLKPGRMRSDLRERPFRFLFAAISAPAGPYAPHKLDFAFLVRRSLLRPEDCLYVPGRALNASQAAALEETGAKTLAATDLARALPWHERIGLALRIVVTTLRVLTKPHGAGNALVTMIARGLPFFAAAQQLRTEVFVGALDEGVDEPPAMPFMRAAGIRTIIWQHALVGFGHADGTGFRHLMLEQSIGAADLTVWTPACREQLCERALLPTVQRGQIFVTGPLMSGDARWLTRGKKAARQAMGLDIENGRWLVVAFDVPTFLGETRRAYRIPMNRVPTDVHDAFFTHLDELLNGFDDIDLALKPKRRKDPRFYVGDPLSDLLDPEGKRQRQGRVHLLQTDVDPYLPIAAADLCIGMPFTSPVAAAANAGIPAFWYAPTSFVRAIHPPELENIVVREQAALASAIHAIRAGTWPEAPACLQAGVGDPQAFFAQILTDARNAPRVQGHGASREDRSIHV